MNVRSLLDLNEQLLNEYYFPDAYLQQKQEENDLALNGLSKRLDFLDSLQFDERQFELAKVRLFAILQSFPDTPSSPLPSPASLPPIPFPLPPSKDPPTWRKML